MRPFACGDCGFEYRWGRGGLLWVLCVVSTTGRSLFQTNPTARAHHWTWSGVPITFYTYYEYVQRCWQVLSPTRKETSYSDRRLWFSYIIFITIIGGILVLFIYKVSQEEWTKLRESVPYVEQNRYNPKHLYPKLNGYGDNGQRSLKLWQLLHTYWLSNTY